MVRYVLLREFYTIVVIIIVAACDASDYAADAKSENHLIIFVLHLLLCLDHDHASHRSGTQCFFRFPILIFRPNDIVIRVRDDDDDNNVYEGRRDDGVS